MKRVLIAVGAMTLLMTWMAYAQAEPPVIDQRQMNQKQRIDQGIASGKLTEQETNLLNKEQEHIKSMEDEAKSDGVVTKKEQARIDRAKDRASRSIAREKHDPLTQKQRIDRGVASGQLTEQEANLLNKEQEQIMSMEDEAKSDGVVTKKEQARIDRAKDRASRNIAREKHDPQGKQHR